MLLLTYTIYGWEYESTSLMLAIVSLIISFGTLAFTFFTYCCQVRKNNKVLRNSLHLDFSKRYQDLIIAIPEGEGFSEKFASLYFDLCSEEYRLRQKESRIIDAKTWELWEDGMKSVLDDHPELLGHWEKNRVNYGTLTDKKKQSFQNYFDQLLHCHFE